MAPTTPIINYPAPRLLRMDTGDDGAAGAVALATSAEKKRGKKGLGMRISNNFGSPRRNPPRSTRTVGVGEPEVAGGTPREDPADGTPRKKARSGEAAGALKGGRMAESFEEGDDDADDDINDDDGDDINDDDDDDDDDVNDDEGASVGRRRPTTPVFITQADVDDDEATNGGGRHLTTGPADNVGANVGRRRPTRATKVAATDDRAADVDDKTASGGHRLPIGGTTAADNAFGSVWRRRQTRSTTGAVAADVEDDEAVDGDDEITSGERRRPTGATTDADTADGEDDEEKGGGRRRRTAIKAVVRSAGTRGGRPIGVAATVELDSSSGTGEEFSLASENGFASEKDDEEGEEEPGDQWAVPQAVAARAEHNARPTKDANLGTNRRANKDPTAKPTAGPTRMPTSKPTGKPPRPAPEDKLARPRHPAKKRPLGSRVAVEPPME